jgi:pyruvate dehydrogenase E1 component beta subunit
MKTLSFVTTVPHFFF